MFSCCFVIDVVTVVVVIIVVVVAAAAVLYSFFTYLLPFTGCVYSGQKGALVTPHVHV